MVNIFSYSQEGYSGHIVGVEVDVRRGLPGIIIVGLAGNSVQEARERVRVAMRNSDFQYPLERIVINLSPASLPKKSSIFDLALAYALLITTHQIKHICTENLMVLGELHLDGTVESVSGVLSAVHEGIQCNINNFIVPIRNYDEALALKRGNIFPVTALKDFLQFNISMKKNTIIPIRYNTDTKNIPTAFAQQSNMSDYNIHAIKGHTKLKRILEIAIAGNHHAILIGPPGSGKTLAARSFPSLLPTLTIDEAIEVTRIISLSQSEMNYDSLMHIPPFRAPHHSISYAGMVGGGSTITPGEIVLAHNGILLLDEVLEFRRDVLQTLRQPLEEREICISRAERAVRFPSDFHLVMTANACPCGNLGKQNANCLCRFEEIKKYWQRLGGAFLDRIPIRIAVFPQTNANQKNYTTSKTCDYKARIASAIEKQRMRYKSTHLRRNGHLRAHVVAQYCILTTELQHYLQTIAEKLQTSMRAVHAICAIARTIADLDASEQIYRKHLQEAISMRSLIDDEHREHALSIVDNFLH